MKLRDIRQVENYALVNVKIQIFSIRLISLSKIYRSSALTLMAYVIVPTILVLSTKPSNCEMVLL